MPHPDVSLSPTRTKTPPWRNGAAIPFHSPSGALAARRSFIDEPMTADPCSMGRSHSYHGAAMQVVTAAIIIRNGSVLLARRGPGDPLAGKWEFPGGKLEDGETPEACLARELDEELSVRASIGELFAESAFHHGSRQLRLLAFHATITAGTPTPSVHSELAWVDPRGLPLFDLLPADVPIAQKLADHLAGA